MKWRLTSVADDSSSLTGTTVVGGDVGTVQDIRLCSLAENIVHTKVRADLAEAEWSNLIGREGRDRALIGRELHRTEIFS